jgi:glucan 1,3-beta-glucosidase
MKKSIFVSTMIIFVTLLAACSAKIVVPNFVGENIDDVFLWSTDNNIDIVVSSEYNDSVEPRNVISQDITPNTKIDKNTSLTVVYSRGYDPEGTVYIPDFSGKTVASVYDWLKTEDIKNFYIYNTFDSSIPTGNFVNYSVQTTEDRNYYKRKDTFTFYFSIGDLALEPVHFENPDNFHGVNLGGWFVLEGWMTPSLFEGVNGSDETAFMEQKPGALQVLQNHWDTFITEQDFAYLASKHLNFVRLPIPWWFRGETFHYIDNDDIEHTITYGDSSFYINRALSWADKYNINVLLDLHTAPGCQNGFDNGGISGILQWEKPENINKTIDVIKDITQIFSTHKSLWGIEVLNEPGWTVNLTTLKQYYVDAYDVIREYNSEVYVGFHDGFRNYMVDSWKSFFQSNTFTNVFFDVHLYQTFGDGWSNYNIFDHVDFVHTNQFQTVHQYDNVVPLVVGEWSLGLQGNVYDGIAPKDINLIREAFGNAQLNVFNEVFGWFFWNYKIDSDSHLEWDMRRLIDQGIFPSDYSVHTPD